MNRYPCPFNEFSTDLEEMPSIMTTAAAEVLYYRQVVIDGRVHNVKIKERPDEQK